MKEYGLLGYPLGHSFSAAFFAEKFQRENIDARYDNFELPSVEGIRDFVADRPNLVGFNVTIPHKQAILPYLDGCSPEAQEIGAVNVVCIRRAEGNLSLYGCNSDIIGFRESLRPLLRPHHTRALVLGTGGASKAVIVALRQLNITPTYTTRRRTSPTIVIGEKEVPVVEYAELTPDTISTCPLIINCSPVGMHPHVDKAPELPYSALTERHLLYDLVYNPIETRFLTLGRQQNATVKNGLEMLHLQALAAWDMWHDAVR